MLREVAAMAAAEDRAADLTTTINLRPLRAVADPFSELLASAEQELLNVIAELPERAAMLITFSGPGKGARYLLDEGETRIGRDKSSAILLDDITVSRNHAVISNVNGNIKIVDSGSLNGTYLNGSLVSQSTLNHGDELQIGKYRLHLYLGGKK